MCKYGIPVTERNIDTDVTPPLEQMNSVDSVGKLFPTECMLSGLEYILPHTSVLKLPLSIGSHNNSIFSLSTPSKYLYIAPDTATKTYIEIIYNYWISNNTAVTCSDRCIIYTNCIR